VKLNSTVKHFDWGVFRSDRFADFLAIIGGLVYAIQSWIMAHTQQSILDEGAYLVKGLLFAMGKYQPFQDYGTWTNHMPLSYLIPGYVQMWFGPGLRTGRYLAVCLGILMVIGIWIVARRLGGAFWAAVIVAALALNPALIKIYSVVASQGLVASMLVWVLVLVLGPNRSGWQLILGAMLAGLIPLTRVNMTPIFPLVMGYIFWEHGRRWGFWSMLVGALVFISGMVPYWPNIMTLWVKWFPAGLTPFFDPWRPSGIGSPQWQPTVNFLTRLVSFVEGLRFHFLPIIAIIVVILFWPRHKAWPKTSNFRITIFLLSMFTILWGMHAWASLGKSYCVFCYSAYLSFFSFLGLLLVPVTFPAWNYDLEPIRKKRRRLSLSKSDAGFDRLTRCLIEFSNRYFSQWRKWVVIVSIFIIPIAIGVSLAPLFSGTVITDPFVRRLIRTPIPRMDGLKIIPGSIELWGFLENKFGWDYVAIQLGTRRLLATLSTGLLGLLVSVALWWGSKPLSWRFFAPSKRHVSALIALVFLGFSLSPTQILGGGRNTYDCDRDVIQSYERVGTELTAHIPSGSLIYWRGGLSTVPLLYLDDFEIFPPQLNNDYSFRDGGNPDTLVKYGFWNDALAHEWVQVADVVLIEERFLKGWLEDEVQSLGFDEFKTQKTAPCRNNSSIYIFWRKP